jgi:subtilase family serine protease
MTHLTKLVFTITLLAQLVHSQERSRVVDRVDNSRVTRFTHTSHPATRIARDLGPAQADLKMDRILMALQISPERQAELEQLIADQHDPASQRYQRWLTPEEFGRQFGPAQTDIDAVTQWLESHGLRVNSISRGRRFLEFSGTAQQVESAFQTEIHHYDLDGEAHIANATNIAVPEALAPVIAGLVSLHNFHSRPMHHGLRAVPLDGITVFSGTIAPDDFATIYNVKPLWNQGFDGTGQSVAIATRSNIRVSDVAAFQSQFGLPANKLQVIVNGPDPGILPSLAEEAEAILDTEWTGAVAKGATVKLVFPRAPMRWTESLSPACTSSITTWRR